MSLDEIKSAVAELGAADRRKLMAFLVSMRNKEDPARKERLTRILDDDAPENWLTLEEMDARLGLSGEGAS